MPLHVLTSTSAAARLEAVGDFLRSQPPAAEVLIVGAHAAPPTMWRVSIARQTGGTFGLIRLGFTDLAARLATERLADARCVPGSLFGAEALATRAVFDAVAAERARVLRAGRPLARLSKGAGENASRVAPGRRRRRNNWPADRRRRPTSRGCWRGSRASSSPLPVADRAALFRLGHRACERAGKSRDGPVGRWCWWTLRSARAAEAVFARTLAAAHPRRSRRCLMATSPPSRP